ncbi:hypothetical protein MIMGU_mgv1a008709mg [Erythranthe guttata]|uniref:F-box domain-containing protein n=1 Tax=Erythranthe guttata TaxID=4155 RepID=A0A022QPA1_ERYGU|nr:PREDICTED: putative F-box protein At4g10190 [Erythranthe guttata]EYU30492.1 hypothetical protein MIMGU_mgv1a008709mg [Erythranthe guttata]|eukprot:XP_012845674.1 PREDICTED: putative F-box protein At4g10190 [Erythranthe guttata]
MGEIEKIFPHDIVEQILSNLPVKSLFRFKSVCKSWNSTISDRRFVGLHIEQSRRSSGNQDIFFWGENFYEDQRLYWCRHHLGWVYRSNDKVAVTKKRDEFLEPKIKFNVVRTLDPVVLCYCDGLALRRFPRVNEKRYALFNLLIGTYIEFTCPYPMRHDPHKTVYGICFDESTNDYKVVIIDRMHYAVYHCMSRSWSPMQETGDEFPWRRMIHGKGVSLNGNLFWVLKTEELPEDEDKSGNKEIVGFDPRSEKLIKLPRPKNTKAPLLWMYLTFLEGDLCLCINQNNHQRIKVGVEDAWREFEGELPLPKQGEEDLQLTPQYETVVKVGYSTTTTGYYRLPYLENLFFSEREHALKKKKKKKNYN